MSELTARRAATREKLVEAALDAFAEKGVLGASVEDICERAGFTRGAFYSNFSSKDELCIALLDAQYRVQRAALDRAIESMAAAPATDLTAQIAAAIDVFFTAQNTDPAWLLASHELRLQAARSPELAPAYRAFTEQARASIAEPLVAALAAHHHTFTVDVLDAVGILHAVHDHAALEAALNPDLRSGSARGHLLGQVLRALIRPVDETARVSSTSAP